MVIDEEEISIADIVNFFYKYARFIIIFSVTVTLFTFVLLLTLSKKLYIAESGLIVLGTKPEVTFEPKIQIKEVSESIIQRFEDRKKSIQELIKTPTVIEPVISKAVELNLINKNEFTYLDFVNGNIVEVKPAGEFIKIKATMKTPELAQFFANEIAKSAVYQVNNLFFYDIPKQILDAKLLEVRQKYTEAVKKYTEYIQTNPVMELLREKTRLQSLYNYYNESINSIERNIWTAKNLKEQLQKGSVSTVGELGNAIALLRYNASIFAGDSELPFKFEFSSQDTTKITGAQINSAVEDIDNIISILQKRKSEFEKELKEQRFEQKIQELETKIEKEKVKERELVKTRDLAWEAMVALERKKEELDISEGITENILVKIAYLSELPLVPKRRYILRNTMISLVLSFMVSTVLCLLKEGYEKSKLKQ